MKLTDNSFVYNIIQYSTSNESELPLFFHSLTTGHLLLFFCFFILKKVTNMESCHDNRKLSNQNFSRRVNVHVLDPVFRLALANHRSFRSWHSRIIESVQGIYFFT